MSSTAYDPSKKLPSVGCGSAGAASATAEHAAEDSATAEQADAGPAALATDRAPRRTTRRERERLLLAGLLAAAAAESRRNCGEGLLLVRLQAAAADAAVRDCREQLLKVSLLAAAAAELQAAPADAARRNCGMSGGSSRRGMSDGPSPRCFLHDHISITGRLLFQGTTSSLLPRFSSSSSPLVWVFLETGGPRRPRRRRGGRLGEGARLRLRFEFRFLLDQSWVKRWRKTAALASVSPILFARAATAAPEIDSPESSTEIAARSSSSSDSFSSPSSCFLSSAQSACSDSD